MIVLGRSVPTAVGTACQEKQVEGWQSRLQVGNQECFTEEAAFDLGLEG